VCFAKHARPYFFLSEATEPTEIQNSVFQINPLSPHIFTVNYLVDIILYILMYNEKFERVGSFLDIKILISRVLVSFKMILQKYKIHVIFDLVYFKKT